VHSSRFAALMLVMAAATRSPQRCRRRRLRGGCSYERSPGCCGKTPLLVSCSTCTPTRDTRRGSAPRDMGAWRSDQRCRSAVGAFVVPAGDSTPGKATCAERFVLLGAIGRGFGPAQAAERQPAGAQARGVRRRQRDRRWRSRDPPWSSGVQPLAGMDRTPGPSARDSGTRLPEAWQTRTVTTAEGDFQAWRYSGNSSGIGRGIGGVEPLFL
jgi:hypothetical protein